MDLTGKVFVLTGALETFTRKSATEEITARGGKVASSVTASSDYLVVGDKPGSKLAAASKLGVEIVDEDDFAEMLDD